MKKQIYTLVLSFILLAPVKLFAYSVDCGSSEQGGLVENCSETSLISFAKTIRGTLLGVAGSLAVLFIVYGGFLYITSGGNEKQTATAKKTITYAIIGLIAILLTWVILGLITQDFLPSIFNSGTSNILK